MTAHDARCETAVRRRARQTPHGAHLQSISRYLVTIRIITDDQHGNIFPIPSMKNPN